MFLLWLLGCQVALAGPWPREKGKGFASYATQLKWPNDLSSQTTVAIDQYDALYLEYGLTNKITVGLDLGRSVSGADKLIAFGQIPLRSKRSGPVVSAQFGFGTIGNETVIRPGISAGWGLPKTWLTLETSIEYAPSTNDTDFKLDATWGWNLPKDRKLIVQLQSGDSDKDDAFLRLAPSIVLPAGRRFKSEFGASWGLIGDDTMGFKMGLWREF